MNSTKYVFRQRVRPTVAPLTAAITLSLGVSQLQAATITVDNLAEGSVAGECTLRDAFTAANTDAAVAGCAAGSGPDSIQFEAGLNGTINLGAPALTTSSVISIAGPGAGLITVSGQNSYRLFGVESASGALTITGLRLADADTTDLYGGSAAAATGGASLTLSDCIVSDNSAGSGATGGAVAAFYSTLSISDCQFSGNSVTNTVYRGGGAAIGGAVLSWGSSTYISDSLFSFNQADYAGGAIAIVESLDSVIVGSTITQNDANFGGGVAAMRASTVTMDYNNLSFNSALAGGGALSVSGSQLSGQFNDVNDNTAQYDGGGILAGVVYGSGGPVARASGRTTPSGTPTSLVSGDGYAYFSYSSIIGNIAQRYGGGMVGKYAGSLAVARASDINFNRAGLPAPGPLELDEARESLAPTGGGGGIYGGGGGMAALYGATTYAYLDNRLYGNEASQGGGMLGFQGTAAAVQSLITGNYAEYGGGLQAGSVTAPTPRGTTTGNGNVLVFGSEVSQNQAFAGGGVMSFYGGYAVVLESDITNNTAAIGGGIASYLSEFGIKYANISGNSALNYGGGIAGISACGDSPILYSTISGNDASNRGGGATISSCGAEISYSLLSANSADIGGGLYMTGTAGAVPQLVNSTVTGNTATDGAGVVGGQVTIRSSTISHNIATSPVPRGTLPPTGGAVLVSGSGVLRVNSSIFSDNSGDGTPSDLLLSGSGTTYFDYSLVEATASLLPGVGNQNGVDPALGPLADNGGRTLTRAIGPASPAVDAGDPSIVLSYDQRGDPWPRGFNGRADIGAFEFVVSEIFSDRFEGP